METVIIEKDDGSWSFHFWKYDKDKRICFYLNEGPWVSAIVDAGKTAPTAFTIPNSDMARSLFEALRDVFGEDKYNSKKRVVEEGELAATKKHLRDLQILLGTKMNVYLPECLTEE